jgi:pyruvate dehydrogenase E1 component alpha subunit
MHTTADDPKRYRTDQEVELWKKRDPIVRFQKYLTDKGLLSAEKIEQIETDIKNEIQEAVDSAESKMKEPVDPLYMFEYMYEEMPPELIEQREELARELAEGEGEESHG